MLTFCKAYLNLENSGRELESIVVGEIQKSYNAYAGILKRESEAAWSTIEELRVGPIAMPKDYEWASFVQRDDQFVDPDVPTRSFQFIHYPGRDHYACQEIRAGLLERKSKYLKSYTAGWYAPPHHPDGERRGRVNTLHPGTCFRRPTCTSSIQRTRPKLRSCRCTCRSRSWGHIQQREDRRTNSSSRGGRRAR